MTVFIEFDDVDDFEAGAVGQPGERVFYLTARKGKERVAVRCEKQQVKAISMYLRHVLSDLPPADYEPVVRPRAWSTAPDALFVLGPIGLGYDRRNDRLLVQLEELVDGDTVGVPGDEDDDLSGLGEVADPERGHIRFYLSREQADAFCEHADVVVANGRPSCTWCGEPIDPFDHACPRMN